jgi:hypothetical protein
MITKTVQNDHPVAKSLRHALRGNALFSGLSGIIFIVGAAPVAEFTGVSVSLPFIILGAVLILYGASLLLVARQSVIRRQYGMLATTLDIGWVIGTAAILLTGWPPLSTAGRWMIALLAEAVAFFAIWQAYAMGLWGQRSR